jgi:arylsulfatase A-like enzyme
MPSRFSAARVAQVGTNKNVGHRMATDAGQDDLEILRALYDGGLHYLDHQIGNLVQSLQTLGILDETVLAITSDHGDSLGEHNQIGHRMALYEPLVHVPLIIRYPAAFQSGARVADQVSLVDLYPTLLAQAGVDETAANARGFYNLLARPEPTTRPAVFVENVAPKSANSMVSRMVRTEQYKYIWNSNQQHELYDLSSDAGELTNLVNSRPVIAQQMCQQLEAWQRSNEQDQVETGRAEYEEVVLERLRDLGYVE